MKLSGNYGREANRIVKSLENTEEYCERYEKYERIVGWILKW